MAVALANGVTLDYHDAADPTPQHYCFLVDEATFDAIMGRIRERAIAFWADPAHRDPGRINTHDGGRGAYFDDPNGHISRSSRAPTATSDERGRVRPRGRRALLRRDRRRRCGGHRGAVRG